jgi:Spy/CpxP family protein refolding chaperone
MKTKSVLVAALLVALSTVGATAQVADKPHATAAERAERMTKKMEKDLSLNSQQVAEVKTLNLQRARVIDSLREEHKGRQKAMKDKRMALDERYKTILTAEQYAKYQQATEERRKKMGERREHKKG